MAIIDDDALTEYQRLDTEEVLRVIEEDDPHGVYDDAYIRSVAHMELNGDRQDLSRVKAAVKGCDTLNGNDFNAALKEAREEIKTEHQGLESKEELRPPPVSEPTVSRTWEDVEAVVLKHFDQKMLDLVEALCANITVLTFKNNASCPMIFLEGPSSAKKTTAIQMTEGTIDEIVIRVDKLSSASFVTHSTEQADDEIGDMDLLPMVQHRVLSVREMSPFLSGDIEKLREIWSVLASIADGDGFEKATGAQGLRGYNGDFRFAFQGATTHLAPIAWNVMGNIGGRVVFHEAIGDYNINQVKDSLYSDDTEFDERLDECRDVVSDFLRTVWHHHADGYASINWTDNSNWRPDEDVQNAMIMLARLVAHARTPANREGNEWKVGAPEDYWRISDLLQQISRGNAFMKGRHRVEMEDMELAARLALSTMPYERRPYVRMLLDPDQPTSMSTTKVMAYVNESKPTVIKYMKLMNQLRLGRLVDNGEGNRSKYFIHKEPEFSNVWETGLPFPERYFTERTDN